MLSNSEEMDKFSRNFHCGVIKITFLFNETECSYFQENVDAPRDNRSKLTFNVFSSYLVAPKQKKKRIIICHENVFEKPILRKSIHCEN